MPHDASTDHVSGAVASAVKPPATDLSTSVDTSNSSTPITAPPASTTTTASNDDRVADVDMETSMTTTADVQVHEPQQRDSGAARHVRLDYCNFVAFANIASLLTYEQSDFYC